MTEPQIDMTDVEIYCEVFWRWFQNNYEETDVKSDYISIRDTWRSFKESFVFKTELKSSLKRQCTYTNIKPILHGFGGPHRCYSTLEVGGRIIKDAVIGVKEKEDSERNRPDIWYDMYRVNRESPFVLTPRMQ